MITLLVMRARGIPVTEGLRLLPDVLRLLRGLAADRTLPWTVRARVWVALAWLISPIDLIPEFLPVIGAVDDVIVVAIALRSLIRRAGPGTVQRHWRGPRTGWPPCPGSAGSRSRHRAHRQPAEPGPGACPVLPGQGIVPALALGHDRGMRIRAELAVSAPAQDAWAVAGERFGEIGGWAPAVTRCGAYPRQVARSGHRIRLRTTPADVALT